MTEIQFLDASPDLEGTQTAAETFAETLLRGSQGVVKQLRLHGTQPSGVAVHLPELRLLWMGPVEQALPTAQMAVAPIIVVTKEPQLASGPFNLKPTKMVHQNCLPK